MKLCLRKFDKIVSPILVYNNPTNKGVRENTKE